jgi:transcriptional regulator with XRE-family HTH domain
MTKSVDNLPKQFGDKVRAERGKLGLSQEQLAFKTGLDRTYISGIERGRRNPSLKNLGKIANALDLPLGKLLTV